MSGPDSPLSDETLMDQVRDGSVVAYTALFDRHRAALYGYALRMAQRPEVAEEVFQDTFLRVFRARGTWSSRDASFRSWLYRIATNAVRDRARQAGRRPEHLSDEEPDLPFTEAPEERLALEHALGQLPENLREAFWLGAVVGLDHHELAEALAITPDNARARVSRARARLRELLEEQ